MGINPELLKLAAWRLDQDMEKDAVVPPPPAGGAHGSVNDGRYASHGSVNDGWYASHGPGNDGRCCAN